MSNININETVLKYDNFINNVLKEDLKRVEVRLQEINTEISDLVQQRHTLKVITDKNLHPNGFKTQVNLGCNFFMEAAVTNTEVLLLNIGLNHYVEFTVEEAMKYLDLRIKAYEKKGEELRDKAAKTKAHIKLMLFGISELQNKTIESS
ncbi:hypothetical protein K1T71_010923 [Dendrolimus kikuchii]|uniref:Uncharacterized protein n=1 Tax=Dendrolimus kikuchii TaxID=765133 RepID=A0ACC1CQ81_9NEOP|nr:hypothetical protein K1T71_010923 [Dendrolimus kikuchii]